MDTNDIPDDHPVIFVDLIKDEPLTREEYANARNHGLLSAAEADEDYAHYLNNFQPWRWHCENAGNHKVLSSGEGYFNEADALENIGQQFGISTMVYLRRAEHGNQLLRSAYPNNLGDRIEIGPQCFAQADGSVLNWRGLNYVPQSPGAAAVETTLAAIGSMAHSLLGLSAEIFRRRRRRGHQKAGGDRGDRVPQEAGGPGVSRRIPAGVRICLHQRAQDCCEICGVWGATNAHHRRNQSQGGEDVLSNLMLACGSGTTGCHGKITANPDWAVEMGYTVKGKVIAPADVEVWRFDITQGVRVLVKLTDDGDVILQDAA